MLDTLFAPDTGLTEAERIRRKFLAGYETELLIEMPIYTLRADNPAREQEAHRYGSKDVSRALRAMERAGLKIVIKDHAEAS